MKISKWEVRGFSHADGPYQPCGLKPKVACRAAEAGATQLRTLPLQHNQGIKHSTAHT